MLHNGTGAILAKQGDYGGSVGAYLKCYQTALRVGNNRVCLQASANLALSFMRLGQYDVALSWTEEPLGFNACDVSPGLFQAAESALLSLSMLGRSDRAEELIRSRRNEFANFGSSGLSQAWALYSADGYAMLGKMGQAEEEGRRATEGSNDVMHMDFCAGPYARWIARTSSSKGTFTQGNQRLENLLSKLKEFDAIDKAEILNALCWLQSRAHSATQLLVTRMLKHLEALPEAVTEQLRRMGMLDFYSKSEADRVKLDVSTAPMLASSHASIVEGRFLNPR
jgi:tetratricopeptide (TPR) repeat protein